MSIVRRLNRFTRELQWRRSNGQRRAPESLEEQIYEAVVRPGDLCLDIGANRGSVSLYLAQLVGPRGRVLSFEPLPPAYVQLCENIQAEATAKATILTFPFGIADRELVSRIAVPRGVFAKGSMASEAEWRRAQQTEDMTSHECSFRPLDDVIGQWADRTPDFIKVDVEGAELLVLRGAERLIASREHPVILMELFAPWEAAFGYKPFDVLDVLQRAGYSILFVCPEGLVPHTASAEKPFPPSYAQGYNVIACDARTHASRAGNLRMLFAGQGGTILPMGAPPMPNRVPQE